MARERRASHLSDAGNRDLFRENQLGFPGMGGSVYSGLLVDELRNAQQQVTVGLGGDRITAITFIARRVDFATSRTRCFDQCVNREQAMSLDPSRRAFVAAAGAAAIDAVTPARAAASNAIDYRTAGELMKVLADRQISSRELIDAAIARIEAIDPKVNAVAVRDFDRAREAAAAADAALVKGDSQPLLGLPMTVKESFNVAVGPVQTT